MIIECYFLKEFNIEGYFDDCFMVLILDICFDQVIFVFDDFLQNIFDYGWDVVLNKEMLINVINIVYEVQCCVFLFVDMDLKVVIEVVLVGVD